MLNEHRVGIGYPPAPSIQGRKLSRLELQLYDMLTQQHQSLTSKLQAQTGAMAQPIFEEGDYGDRASKSTGQSKQLAMERLWQSMRAEVELALERLAQGTYGLCELCGAPIHEERLMAFPSTARCIECARRQGSMQGQLKATAV